MNKDLLESRTPKLLVERVVDDRGARFGKEVIERDFEMPNGKVFSILCVRMGNIHPVVIFPFSANHTVFLVHQHRFGTNSWLYELPGGCKKPGQSIEQTAQAELLEEVGVEADSFEIIGDPLQLNPALEDNQIIPVIARNCRISRPQALDDTETAIVHEVSIDDLKLMIRRREITDSKTIAITYLALDHLGFL